MSYNTAPTARLLEASARDHQLAATALRAATAQVNARLRAAGYVVPIEFASGLSAEEQAEVTALLASYEEGVALDLVSAPVRGGRGSSEDEARLESVARSGLRDLVPQRRASGVLAEPMAQLPLRRQSAVPSVTRGLGPAPLRDGLWDAVDAIP